MPFTVVNASGGGHVNCKTPATISDFMGCCRAVVLQNKERIKLGDG